jgi:hypothetical protein
MENKMNHGQELVRNISKIKIDILDKSIFKDEASINSFLSNFSEDEQLDKYMHETKLFNTLLMANIKELHENLEIFYSNEDELRAARIEANKIFNERMSVIYESKIIKNIFERNRLKFLKELEERDKVIEVDGKEYEVIKRIDVYWTGWECDQYAYAVKTDEGVKLVTSDQGIKSFTKSAFLEDKINEYKEALSSTEEMLALINN